MKSGSDKLYRVAKDRPGTEGKTDLELAEEVALALRITDVIQVIM